MMPLVSVVIPVYNTEAYLSKCLDSVCSQSLKDIEIIIVDDGSTDGSSRVIGEYASKDQRVKAFRKANGGQSLARNLGLEHSTGEYIAFVDSDDWIEANMLESMYNIAVSSGAELAICDFSRVFDNAIKPKAMNFKDEVIRMDCMAPDVFFKNYVFNYRLGHELCNRLFKREVIEAFGLRFASNKLVFGEDMLFNFEYYLHISTIVTLSYPFYNYRQRPGSTMLSDKPNLMRRYMNVLSLFTQHIEAYLPGETMDVVRTDVALYLFNSAVFDSLIISKKGFLGVLGDVKISMESKLFRQYIEIIWKRPDINIYTRLFAAVYRKRLAFLSALLISAYIIIKRFIKERKEKCPR